MKKNNYDIVSQAIAELKRIKFFLDGKGIIGEPHFIYSEVNLYCAVKMGDKINHDPAYIPINSMENLSILNEHFSPDMAIRKEEKEFHERGLLIQTISSD